jgi:hypothetical protein
VKTPREDAEQWQWDGFCGKSKRSTAPPGRQRALDRGDHHHGIVNRGRYGARLPALGAGARAMTARWLQWVAVVALGCIRLDDVAGYNDARLLRPDVADRIQIEFRSTLPLVGTIWPQLSPPSFDELLTPSPSGCQTGDYREGQG